MKPIGCSRRVAKGLFRLLAGILVTPLAPTDLLVSSRGGQPVSVDAAKRVADVALDLGAAEVRFADGSMLKLRLKDEQLRLITPYGKLLIPVADIHRIEFAWRTPPDIAKRLEAAIADLGSSQFRQREAATAELRRLGERAYPALLEAAKDKDPEVERRAETLLKQLREAVTEDLPEVRDKDVVHTQDSKIAGQIEAVVLKADTFQFGEVQLKLVDLRGLHSLAAGALDPEQPHRAAGKQVQVQQGGQWWPAEILAAKAGKYHIHYKGWDASFDEWVTKDRVLFSNAKGATGKMLELQPKR